MKKVKLSTITLDDKKKKYDEMIYSSFGSLISSLSPGKVINKWLSMSEEEKRNIFLDNIDYLEKTNLDVSYGIGNLSICEINQYDSCLVYLNIGRSFKIREDRLEINLKVEGENMNFIFRPVMINLEVILLRSFFKDLFSIYNSLHV